MDGSKVDDTSNTTLLECDSISEGSIRSMQEISNWLRKATSMVNSAAVTSTGDNQKSRRHLARIFHSEGSDSNPSDVYQLPQSLTQYCKFRMDLMRVTLVKYALACFYVLAYVKCYWPYEITPDLFRNIASSNEKMSKKNNFQFTWNWIWVFFSSFYRQF